jgi:hypothetical protein
MLFAQRLEVFVGFFSEFLGLRNLKCFGTGNSGWDGMGWIVMQWDGVGWDGMGMEWDGTV